MTGYRQAGLTETETAELTHWSRFGSDGYPIRKLSSGNWILPHFPVVYKTKREAAAQWERYIDALIERHGLAVKAEAELAERGAA